MKREEIKKEIKRRKELIQNMKNDEEIFGLVGEDYAKINKWCGELSILQQKLDLSKDRMTGSKAQTPGTDAGRIPLKEKGEI